MRSRRFSCLKVYLKMFWKIVLLLLFLECTRKFDFLIFNHVFFAKLFLLFITFKFFELHRHNTTFLTGVTSLIVIYLMTVYWQVPYLSYQYFCYFYTFFSISNASTLPQHYKGLLNNFSYYTKLFIFKLYLFTNCFSYS